MLLPGLGFGQTSSIDGSLSLRPFAEVPPGTVTDLGAVSGALEGQITLNWTAPPVYPGSALDSYQVRLQTFSVADVGGSSTAWWNNPTGALVQSFYGVGPGAAVTRVLGPAPADHVLALEPGVTYYLVVRSADDLGTARDFWSNLSNISTAAALDLPPSAPAWLSASPLSSSAVNLAWGASTASDLWRYRVDIDSITPLDFANGWSVYVSSTATALSVSNLSTGTLAFRVVALDKGEPNYPGIAYASAASSTTATLTALVRLAQEPFGVNIATAPGSATISWLPVQRWQDGSYFANPAAPIVDELYAYRVYRATYAVAAPWTQMVELSTSALSWTDLGGGSQHYYQVRSYNSSGESRSSTARAAGSLSFYAASPDERSYLEVFVNDTWDLVGADPASTYLVRASSKPADASSGVFKVFEVRAHRGGKPDYDVYQLPGRGVLRLGYELSGGALTPSGVPAQPENLSVFWNNGSRWVQLYGQRDALNRLMIVETPYFGEYQLRTVDRATGFHFNMAGVSNRTVTPNGDGKNDNMVFIYDNPKNSEVSARILDLRGRVIVAQLPPGPLPNSRSWDGLAGGRPVPGGVYLYILEAEGQSFTGAVLVIR